MPNERWAPGPWAVTDADDDDPDFIWFVVAENEMWVAAMYQFAGGEDTEGKANACLISAAPELYEALEEMIRQYDDLEIEGGEPTEMTLAHGRAHNTLAKARGER